MTDYIRMKGHINRLEVVEKGLLGKRLECGCVLEYGGDRCEEAKRLWEKYMELNPKPPPLTKEQAEALAEYGEHFNKGIRLLLGDEE